MPRYSGKIYDLDTLFEFGTYIDKTLKSVIDYRAESVQWYIMNIDGFEISTAAKHYYNEAISRTEYNDKRDDYWKQFYYKFNLHT